MIKNNLTRFNLLCEYSIYSFKHLHSVDVQYFGIISLIYVLFENQCWNSFFSYRYSHIPQAYCVCKEMVLQISVGIFEVDLI